MVRVSRNLVLVGPATSEPMRRAAEAKGLRYAAEAFADRAYKKDGTLQSRSVSGAVISDPEIAAARAVRIARDGVVAAGDETEIPLRADTICLHGDTPGALEIARTGRAALEAAGIAVQALDR